MPQLNRFKLDTVAKALKVSLENHHRAVDDAGCTAEIFVKFIEMLQKQRYYRRWMESMSWGVLPWIQIRKMSDAPCNYSGDK